MVVVVGGLLENQLMGGGALEFDQLMLVWALVFD